MVRLVEASIHARSVSFGSEGTVVGARRGCSGTSDVILCVHASMFACA
jgi:hypothetical protein